MECEKDMVMVCKGCIVSFVIVGMLIVWMFF